MSTFEQPPPNVPHQINLKADSCLSRSTLQFMRGVTADEHAPQPILTVVVVAYRHENYIEECLASINRTLMQSIELLVIDDGSPDSTLRKCLDFQFRSDIDVRVYTKTNQGLVHSLFNGLELARGRYISIMASDDCYMDHGLDAALRYLQENPDTDALLCQAETIGLIGGMAYGTIMEAFFGLTPLERLEAIWSEAPAPMLLQATIFNAKFLRSINPWADNLELDDWPTFIRVFAAEAMFGAKVRYCPELILSKYRIHSEGSHAKLDRHLRIIEQVANEFVPEKYRNICLANARVDIGIGNIREGRLLNGLCLLGCAIFFNAFVHSVVRVLKRGVNIILKRIRPLLFWQFEKPS